MKKDHISIHPDKMAELHGIPASLGIAMGKARVFVEEVFDISKITILKHQIKDENERLIQALQATKKELVQLQNKVLESTGKEKADFFNLHLILIEDAVFIQKITDLIKISLKNAEWAVYDVIETEIKKLKEINDEYLKERATDLSDIGKRIIRHLQKKEKETFASFPEDTILVATDLSPADTAILDLSKVKGFITNQGGRTSHTAILARALDIPAVVGVNSATSLIRNNDRIIVDANTGKVIINADERTVKIYNTARHVFHQFRHSLEKIAQLEPETKDGRRVDIAGNIEIPEEADAIIKNGGNGIGLYRTEFLYMNREHLPSEDDLFKVFKEVAERMRPAPVVFRTLDIGGDKFSTKLYDGKPEANPFLGWRAIRYCLENIDLFTAQLKAMIMASAFGNVKIMIPMISDISEVHKTRQIVEKIKKELDQKQIPFDKQMELGTMIEIPSAALTSDVIGREVDFFSVGSNDLVQYTMACDRNNPKIAYLFDPFHPAVIKLLKTTIDSARKHGIRTSVCGEMGAEPIAIPLLVGLGFDELSVAPSVIPEVKKVVRSLEYSEAQKIADKVLTMENSPEIHKYLKRVLKQFAPEILERKA